MQTQLNTRETIVKRLLGSSRQDTALISIALGAVALLAVIAALGLGAAQQAQLGATAQSVGDTGRVVVQLQRETLRLLALVRQNPQPFWANPSLEPATVLWATVLGLAGGVLVGLLPAFKATLSSDRIRAVVAKVRRLQLQRKAP